MLELLARCGASRRITSQARLIDDLMRLLTERGNQSPGLGIHFERPQVVVARSDQLDDFIIALKSLQKRFQAPGPQIIVSILRRTNHSQVRVVMQCTRSASFSVCVHVCVLAKRPWRVSELSLREEDSRSADCMHLGLPQELYNAFKRVCFFKPFSTPCQVIEAATMFVAPPLVHRLKPQAESSHSRIVCRRCAARPRFGSHA